jgi:hypothetical protein
MNTNETDALRHFLASLVADPDVWSPADLQRGARQALNLMAAAQIREEKERAEQAAYWNKVRELHKKAMES